MLGTKGGSGFPLYLNNTNYITINNCYLYGGNYGAYIAGNNSSSSTPTGNLFFSNNKIVEFQNYAIFVNNTGGYGENNNAYSNNVIDSANNASAYGILTEYETGATYSGNKVLCKLGYGFYIYGPNNKSTAPLFQVDNNFFTKYTNYGIYVNVLNGSGGNVLIDFNTLFTDSTMQPQGCIVATSGISKGLSIESNIFEQLISNNTSTYALLTLNGTASEYNVIDGNDLYAPGQNYGYLFGTSYKDFPTYQQAMKGNGWESNATTFKPVYIGPPTDLHLNQTVSAPIGLYTGLSTDIDGNTRCKLFPTAGAHESSYEKGAPTARFFLPSVIYPGSPATITQTAKLGEPKSYAWYVNGVLVSDSVTLFTNKFVTGVDSIRLVVTSCGGTSTYKAIDTVKAPKSVPNVDFVSNTNVVQTGQPVLFEDVSTNGPTSWNWEITPSTTGTSSTYAFVNSDSTSQNPQVQFLVSGNYTVCLKAGNGIGAGSQNCKIDFITVYRALNIGSQNSVNDSTGYLYDDGGPNAPYKNNGGTNSILINPCADTIYLTFSMFDLYCGNAYLKVYQGKDNTGKLLGPCPLGFTGGATFSCASLCLPNVSKPDTFKAKNFMYIQMTDGVNNGAAGFAAHWWSKLKKGSNPIPSFVSSESGDSVCVGHRIAITNTTKIDPDDPPSFSWYTGGPLVPFPCPGSCITTIDSYSVSGQIPLTLIASSCGGTDSTTQTITVYNPPPPSVTFRVDNQNPTQFDYIYFTSNPNVCIDDYKWVFTKSDPTDTGSAVFQAGTNPGSSDPIVTFSDTGYYDVTLQVDNNLGVQKNSAFKKKYIHVRPSYCTPLVHALTSDIGISKVVFNQITNYTKPGSAVYSNFVNTPSLSTAVQLGLTYPLTLQRDSPAYNTITRTAFIDWNQDGVFSSNEVVGVDSNSKTIKWTKNIKVPSNATLGATLMRLAVNVGSGTNNPCGPNTYGEFQDYRIYVQPYHQPPVITLKGKDTINLELGYSFVEPGYIATSALYGNMTSQVKVTSGKLSIPFPGGTLYSYNVTDSSGQKAPTAYRYVLYVKDTIAPTLIVAGPDTSKSEVNTKIVIPKVTSTSDLVTKILHPVIDTSQVNHKVIGIYPVYYTLTDSAGNKTTVVRYVSIVDSIAPILKLKGPAIDTIVANSAYKDSGVVVIDNYYRITLLDSLVKTSFSPALNVNVPGIYTETYTLTDPSGNKAKSITRKIVVADKTPPVITLTGPSTDSVEVKYLYTDPGVTVTDNVSKSSQITVNYKLGTFYSFFPSGTPDSLGTFTIIYVARDLAGNISSKTRIVKVQDRIAPVVTLIGNQSREICRWKTYIDSGYTVTDNYDKGKNIKVDTIGTFLKYKTSIVGLFDLAYLAIDRSGNKSALTYRGITVDPETYSQCTSGIQEGLKPDKYVSVYPNPGSGVFLVNMNFPPDNISTITLSASITVTDVIGREVAISNDVVVNGNIFRLDLSSQPSGVYFLNIVCGNQRTVKRIEIAK